MTEDSTASFEIVAFNSYTGPDAAADVRARCCDAGASAGCDYSNGGRFRMKQGQCWMFTVWETTSLSGCAFTF